MTSKNTLIKILLGIVVILIASGLSFLLIRYVLPKFGLLTSSNKIQKITWWSLWEDPGIVQPLIDEYEKSHPKVKIAYVKQAKEDYRERLTNALAQGKGPDIFRIHNSWVAMFRNDLDRLPSSVMSASEFAKTFYPVASSDLSLGTSIVGIPLEYDGLGLFINEDIFDRAGKTPPSTWDDLRKVAIDLTVKDEKGNIQQAGVALGRTENVDHWPEIVGLMMLQNHAKLTSPKGKLAEDALKFFTIFSSVDGVWDATLPPSTASFASGRLAMYLGPSWRVFEIKSQNPDLHFRVLPVPQLPKDVPTDQDISYASYWSEVVWERSESKDAAWEFLQFLSTPGSLQKLYANASKIRLFGEPYPRADMGQLLLGDPIVGGFISQASYSQSGFLASNSWDGESGINSKMAKYFEDAINSILDGKNITDVTETLSQGVKEVLTSYGIVSAK